MVDGALEGWQRIIDLGYHPRVCSSPITNHPTCASEKIQWLWRQFVPTFGAYVVREAIITKEKHLYAGVALMDDRPEVRHANKAPWLHILFDRPYNRHSTQPRLLGWHDDNLGTLLEQATLRVKTGS